MKTAHLVSVVGTALFVLSAVAVATCWPTGVPRDFHIHRGNSYTRCDGNLRQIAMALKHYHDALGQFPPRIVKSESGTPMHGWRRIILQFTDYHPFDMSEYRWDRAWDSVENRPLGEWPIQIYQCDADSSKSVLKSYTSFFCLTDYCNDNRLVLLECHGANVRWTRPKDLDLQDLASLLRQKTDRVAKEEPAGLAVIGKDTVRVFAVFSRNPDDFIAEVDRDVGVCQAER